MTITQGIEKQGRRHRGREQRPRSFTPDLASKRSVALLRKAAARHRGLHRFSRPGAGVASRALGLIASRAGLGAVFLVGVVVLCAAVVAMQLLDAPSPA